MSRAFDFSRDLLHNCGTERVLGEVAKSPLSNSLHFGVFVWLFYRALNLENSPRINASTCPLGVD
jgi:hypothetical protein